MTEYNPDKIAEANKTSIVYGTFDYVATGLGGSVHRYQDCEVFEDSELTVDGDVMVEDKKYKNHVRNGSNNIWQSGGIYDGKFIMDRNLGAVDTLYPVANPDILGMEPFLGKGAVYYQFGRNTPFPGRSAMGGNNSAYLFSTAFNADAPTMKARVLNPITFYKASGWGDPCTIDFNGTDYLWNDFKAKITNTTGGTTGRQKSIFDPSPLGWRLPINGTWSDFGQLTAINRWRTSQSLISYGDTGANNLVKGTGGTFYPGSSSYWLLGTRYLNSTATVSAGYSWSASPSLTTSQGYHLHFSYADANGEHNMNPSHSSARLFGFPVRPVQE